ncbi:MarR family winged helix-turn-helix transcriptional regulator [Ruminococcaceae bacterium OttesenSCG-928-I18]|nr:MarR family winged helix-turn-helix transcriptional regulator [Ruminococcaceae bacterium OttesenSCG-928-I18]
MDPFDFQWKMLAGIRRVKEQTERVIHPFCEKSGLTPIQLRILITLYFEGPQTVRALSQNTCMAVANNSVQCKRLGALGLVERRRDKSDERQVRVSLTAQGNAMVEELRFSSEASLRTLADNISEDDAERILNGLEKVAVIFEEENAS